VRLSRTQLLIGVVLLCLAGCTTERQHHWLTTFFDGVDAPPATSAPVSATITQTNGATLTAAARLPPPPQVFYHEPYTERKCAECHTTAFSQKLRATGTELCAGCHKKFMAKISEAKFVHRPLEKGQCLRCHEPHSAPERFLLIRNGQDLCLKCHDKEDMAEVKGHAKMGSATCLSCHDPHVGNTKGLPRTQ